MSLEEILLNVLCLLCGSLIGALISISRQVQQLLTESKRIDLNAEHRFAEARELINRMERAIRESKNEH